MAWLSGYARRYPITFSPASALAEAVAGAPVCVRPGDLTGLVQADMDDAVVTGADGTTLVPYYWESKTLTAPVGHALFSLPSGSGPTLLGYLYTGNASVTDQSNEAGVFSSFASRHSMADATDATAVDSCGAHHAASSGGTTSVTGKVGKGLAFDGVDSKLTTSSNYIGTSACTVSAWIYATSLLTYGRIVDDSKTYFTVDASRYIKCSSNGLTLATSAIDSVRAGVWRHVAFTRTSDGTANLYVSGALSGTANQSSGTPVAGGAEIIGSRAADNTRVFAGTLDDVRIALSVRSASSILAEYLSGAGTLLTVGAAEFFPSGRRRFNPNVSPGTNPGWM